MFEHRLLCNFDDLNALEFDKLRDSWNLLATSRGTPLLGFDWFHSCATTMHTNDELRIVLIISDGEISAIAPLFIRSGRGFKRLELLGVRHLYEPSGLLYKGSESLARLLERVLALNLPVVLDRIPTPEMSTSIARSSGRRQGLRIVRPSAASTFLEIGDDWESFLIDLSQNRKRDLARKHRRASKIGEVRIDVIVPSQSNLDRNLKLALQIEDQSWKGASGSSLLQRQDLLGFFQSFSEKACQNGQLRLFFLVIGERPVAMQIGLQADNTLWILKLGYNNEFSDCSPGVALSQASIKYCFENKLRRYEFLGSEEKWQSSWPIKRHQYCTVFLFPWSFSGLIGLLSMAIERLVRSGTAR